MTEGIRGKEGSGSEVRREERRTERGDGCGHFEGREGMGKRGVWEGKMEGEGKGIMSEESREGRLKGEGKGGNG